MPEVAQRLGQPGWVAAGNCRARLSFLRRRGVTRLSDRAEIAWIGRRLAKGKSKRRNAAGRCEQKQAELNRGPSLHNRASMPEPTPELPLHVEAGRFRRYPLV